VNNLVMCFSLNNSPDAGDKPGSELCCRNFIMKPDFPGQRFGADSGLGLLF
jgi:hypothetical protein